MYNTMTLETECYERTLVNDTWADATLVGICDLLSYC
jgi:hypothetical protein